MKAFEILKSFLTEKMDDLTKQLFSDVQKEENQRMYGIWILLFWSRLHFFSSPAFLSPSVNVLYSHHYESVSVLGHECWYWSTSCTVEEEHMLVWGSVTHRKLYCRLETLLALAVSCLFMCLPEKGKATPVIMVSLEISSEFGQDWKRWPYPSELLWSEY